MLTYTFWKFWSIQKMQKGRDFPARVKKNTGVYTDIQYNLELARLQREDEFNPLPPFFLAQWWANTHRSLTANTWSILACLLMWGGAIGWGLWFVASKREQRKYGFTIGCVLLLLGILTTFLARSQARFEQFHPYAIVLNTAPLRFAPDEDSKAVLDLHEGTKVKLLDQFRDWRKIRLPNGEEGWLPLVVMEQI